MMKLKIRALLLALIMLIINGCLIGCGDGAQSGARQKGLTFSLMTNYYEFEDSEIDSVLLDDIISSFTPDDWDFAVLSPDAPIQNSTFIQVGAPSENVGYQYTVEIGFETSEKGLALYRMYTADKELALKLIVDYWQDHAVPDIQAWEDVTWELGPSPQGRPIASAAPPQAPPYLKRGGAPCIIWA